MNPKFLLIIILLLSSSSCQRDTKSRSNNKEKPIAIQDSIVFGSAKNGYSYIGERLYPAENDFSLIDTEIISIDKVNDTIFVFLLNDMLNVSENDYLIQINDSLIKHYYSQLYEVDIDDEPPFFISLENEKDFIIIDPNDNTYSWIKAIIEGSDIFSFSNIKIGMNKEKVFSYLDFPPLNIEENNFKLILCHASQPSYIWYKEILKRDGNSLESPVKDKFNFSGQKATFQILLDFEDDSLKCILLDQLITYTNMGKNLFRRAY